MFKYPVNSNLNKSFASIFKDYPSASLNQSEYFLKYDSKSADFN